jgi:hypothetical protein
MNSSGIVFVIAALRRGEQIVAATLRSRAQNIKQNRRRNGTNKVSNHLKAAYKCCR